MTQVLMWRGDALAGYGFAEKPWFLPNERLPAILDEVERRGLVPRLRMMESRAATDDELARFHDRAYVERVTARCQTNDGALDHGPTPARAHVERAARHVVGSVLDAARCLLAGEAKRAFVPIAGFHHARRAEARSYCLYNDSVLALTTLLDAIPTESVGYVDVDVHQGDGVYEAFASEPRVALVDLHESWRTLFPHSPEQPGTEPVSGEARHRGEGLAEGTKLNIELAPRLDDAGFLEAWRRAEAFLEAARPAFIVFEAGVDHLGGDAMGHLDLTEACVGHVTERLVALADRHAGGRLLVLGGGTYSSEGARRGWGAVVEALTR